MMATKKKTDPVIPEGKLVYIPIDKLNEHPDNPRKDIGDVTELAESIKAKGVLQNLTVVPYVSPVHGRVMEGLYTILIGHRRFAAAKLAGLKELPCVIVEMSKEDQIATMLVENMQRSDLTIYEEAKGFQMMLDLGKTVKDVSDMSGFSETTVKRRVKLAALDEKKFKKAVDRGATLFDFAKLDEIEDEQTRDELLDVIGKPDFKNNLAYALKKQKNAHLIAGWIEQISKWATPIESVDWKGSIRFAILDGNEIPVKYVRNYTTYGTKETEIPRPEDADTATYYYLPPKTRADVSQVDVYRKLEKEDMDAEAQKEAEARRIRDAHDVKKKKFEEMSARHRELRFEFVKNFNQFQKRDADVWEFIIEAMVYAQRNGGGYYNAHQSLEKLGEILGIEYKEATHELDYHAFLDAKRHRPEQTALLTAMWIMDKGCFYTDKWCAEQQRYLIVYQQCDILDKLYRLLSSLGYLQSTEETELRGGTHKLFDKLPE